jgi:hypothetical protein
MYIWFDHFFEWETIWPDIIKRPFVLAGMVSWGMMLALAVSSPQAVLRWMGGKRWQRLHQLMYVLMPVAVLHVYWMKAGKHDFFWPAVYGGLTVLLLVCGSGLRVVLRVRSEEMFGFFCCNRIKIEILCTAAHNFRSQTETGIIMQSYLLKPGQTKGITRKLALLVLGLFGWKCFISPCPDRAASSSFIRISNWDFPIGVLGKIAIGQRFHFIAKSSLFEGLPVRVRPVFARYRRCAGRTRRGDRCDWQNCRADQPQHWYWLALAPEGTRSLRPYWRSGFTILPVLQTCRWPVRILISAKMHQSDRLPDADRRR